MFYGCEFSFNGISCAAFGLALYNFGSSKSSSFDFASPAKFDEDSSRHGYKNKFFGQKQRDPLEIKLTFGLFGERLDRGVDVRDPRYLRRSEINIITSWLTGTRGYRRLEIDQPDMKDYYYKAHCTKLTLLGDDWYPYAFEATFECDSPYAYQDKTSIVAELTSADWIPAERPLLYYKVVYLPNSSAYGGTISPVVNIDISPLDPSRAWTDEIRIWFVNYFDSDLDLDSPATMGFAGLPRVSGRLTVDCEKCLLTHSDKSVSQSDLYTSSTAGFLKIHPANEAFERFRDGHTGDESFIKTEQLTVDSSGSAQRITVTQRPLRIYDATVGGITYMQNDEAVPGQKFVYDPHTGIITFAAAEPTISGSVLVRYYSPFFEQWKMENDAGILTDMDVSVNPVAIMSSSLNTKFTVTFEYDCPVDIGG